MNCTAGTVRSSVSGRKGQQVRTVSQSRDLLHQYSTSASFRVLVEPSSEFAVGMRPSTTWLKAICQGRLDEFMVPSDRCR